MVELSRPLFVEPNDRASSSVASPNNLASGIIAKAEAINTIIGLASNHDNPIPMGINNNNHLSSMIHLKFLYY